VTLIGVDGRARFVASQFDVFEEATLRPLATSDSVLRVYDRVFGAYVQQTWSPAPWLALNGGGRLDYDQRFGQRISPRVAASLQTWRGGTFKAIYSEAFRAPSWQESHSALESQVPADNLQPETVRSIEGAIDQKLGSHRLLFGVFRSWWSDLVELHILDAQEVREARRAGTLPLFVSASATQYRNVASIDNYGFNSGYEGTFANSRLRYGVNVTGAIARRNDPALGTAPLTVAPQIFGNARISYSFGDAYPTAALAAHFLGSRASDRAAYFIPPPYAPPLVELRATLTGVIPGIKGLSYRATANYAFAAHGPYVIGPVQTGIDTQHRDPVTGEIKVRDRPAELIPVDRFRVGVGLQYDF
jgi:outer membrane receptor protein involved in Fe transport